MGPGVQPPGAGRYCRYDCASGAARDAPGAPQLQGRRRRAGRRQLAGVTWSETALRARAAILLCFADFKYELLIGWWACHAVTVSREVVSEGTSGAGRVASGGGGGGGGGSGWWCCAAAAGADHPGQPCTSLPVAQQAPVQPAAAKLRLLAQLPARLPLPAAGQRSASDQETRQARPISGRHLGTDGGIQSGTSTAAASCFHFRSCKPAEQRTHIYLAREEGRRYAPPGPGLSSEQPGRRPASVTWASMVA